MSKELRQMMDEEREAGWKEGKKEGMISILVGMVKDGILTITDAANRLGVSKKKFTELAGLY